MHNRGVESGRRPSRRRSHLAAGSTPVTYPQVKVDVRPILKPGTVMYFLDLHPLSTT
jgi:hypothetical protein